MNEERPNLEAFAGRNVRAHLGAFITVLWLFLGQHAVAEPLSCSTDTTLCLGGRFQIVASWTAPDGTAGSGHAVPLTPNSGYFWFFDPSNVEIVAKMVDACSIGSGEWLFAAGMTNVGVQLTATDTYTGGVKAYGNTPHGSDPGVLFEPILDTTSFPTCRTEPPQTIEVVLQSERTSCLQGSETIASPQYLFAPREIHVHVGDSVTWTSAYGTHDISGDSSDGTWSSGEFDGHNSYTRLYNQPGTFRYTCVSGHSAYLPEYGSTRAGACVFVHYNEIGFVIVDP